MRIVVIDTRAAAIDASIARELAALGHATSLEFVAFATAGFAAWRATVPPECRVWARSLPAIGDPLQLRDVIAFNTSAMIEQILDETRADLGIVLGECPPVTHPRVAPKSRGDLASLVAWAERGRDDVQAWLAAAPERAARRRPPEELALAFKLDESPQD